jgi:two-component system, LytTR family, sensor kinase
LLHKTHPMKEFIYNPDTLKKIEFWAATTIFVFAVFFLSTSAVSPEVVNRISDRFDEANFTFNYYENYFFPKLIQYTVLYGAFCFLNFKVVPALIKKESLARDIVFVILIFILIGLVFGVTDTYLKNYLFAEYETEEATYNAIFQQSFLYAFWLLFMFGFYTVVKYTSLHLLSNSEAIQSKYQLITRDGLIAFVLWMVSMFLLLLGDVDGEFLISWGVIIPSGILFYLYSFYTLIPNALGKNKPFRAYLGKTFLIQILAILPLSLLIFIIINDEETAIVLSLFNAAFQLLITAPLAWSLFKRQMKGKEEIFVLQKELGRSNANLDFLRAQINPHFLFNTLNTLYGTALQENSERTAQGIRVVSVKY